MINESNSVETKGIWELFKEIGRGLKDICWTSDVPEETAAKLTRELEETIEKINQDAVKLNEKEEAPKENKIKGLQVKLKNPPTRQDPQFNDEKEQEDKTNVR